jgi:hypothetical protein
MRFKRGSTDWELVAFFCAAAVVAVALIVCLAADESNSRDHAYRMEQLKHATTKAVEQ